MKHPIGYRLTYGVKKHRTHEDFFSGSAWADIVRYIRESNLDEKNPTIGPLYERI